MIPIEVIEIAMLIDGDFLARTENDRRRAAALDAAWNIWNDGYRRGVPMTDEREYVIDKCAAVLSEEIGWCNENYEYHKYKTGNSVSMDLWGDKVLILEHARDKIIAMKTHWPLDVEEIGNFSATDTKG